MNESHFRLVNLVVEDKLRHRVKDLRDARLGMKFKSPQVALRVLAGCDAPTISSGRARTFGPSSADECTRLGCRPILRVVFPRTKRGQTLVVRLDSSLMLMDCGSQVQSVRASCLV